MDRIMDFTRRWETTLFQTGVFVVVAGIVQCILAIVGHFEPWTLITMLIAYIGSALGPGLARDFRRQKDDRSISLFTHTCVHFGCMEGAEDGSHLCVKHGQRQQDKVVA